MFLRHGLNGELMHGPLLGWSKLIGAEIYWTKDGRCDFGMCRLPGVPFDHFPYSDHGRDAICAMKSLLLQANLWIGCANRLPSRAAIPSQSTWETNLYLLKKEFASAWPEIVPSPASPEGEANIVADCLSACQTGFQVLQRAPAGIELLIKDSKHV